MCVACIVTVDIAIRVSLVLHTRAVFVSCSALALNVRLLLQYVLHFPKDETYVSLLVDPSDAAELQRVQAARTRLRALVQAQLVSREHSSQQQQQTQSSQGNATASRPQASGKQPRCTASQAQAVPRGNRQRSQSERYATGGGEPPNVGDLASPAAKQQQQVHPHAADRTSSSDEGASSGDAPSADGDRSPLQSTHAQDQFAGRAMPAAARRPGATSQRIHDAAAAEASKSGPASERKRQAHGNTHAELSGNAAQRVGAASKRRAEPLANADAELFGDAAPLATAPHAADVGGEALNSASVAAADSDESDEFFGSDSGGDAADANSAPLAASEVKAPNTAKGNNGSVSETGRAGRLHPQIAAGAASGKQSSLARKPLPPDCRTRGVQGAMQPASRAAAGTASKTLGNIAKAPAVATANEVKHTHRVGSVDRMHGHPRFAPGANKPGGRDPHGGAAAPAAAAGQAHKRKWLPTEAHQRVKAGLPARTRAEGGRKRRKRK